MLFILVRLHHYACWTKASGQHVFCSLLMSINHYPLTHLHKVRYIYNYLYYCNTFYSQQLKMAFRAFSAMKKWHMHISHCSQRQVCTWHIKATSLNLKHFEPWNWSNKYLIEPKTSSSLHGLCSARITMIEAPNELSKAGLLIVRWFMTSALSPASHNRVEPRGALFCFVQLAVVWLRWVYIYHQHWDSTKLDSM